MGDALTHTFLVDMDEQVAAVAPCRGVRSPPGPSRWCRHGETETAAWRDGRESLHRRPVTGSQSSVACRGREHLLFSSWILP